MEQSYNDELVRIYDQIRMLQSGLSNLAKDFYKQSVISYNEIQGTPQTLSSFYNDMNYVSKEEVDYKILSIPSIDDSNYLKKSGDKIQDCNVVTTFAGLKTVTPRKDDSSNTVATTEFVHELIDESSKNTEKYISGIYLNRDNVSQEQMEAAIKKALLQYYSSMEVDSKIISAISRLYIPSKTSDLRNDNGFITINDVPLSAVTSVNGQIGDVDIQIPTIPTLISTFINDAGYITDPGVTSVNNRIGAVYVQENVQTDWNSTTGLSAILNRPSLRRVAITGNYNDLDDKPTIPINISLLINDSGFLTEHQDISGKANIEDLASVAFSGSYRDLNDKPTIPTNLSELTNDGNFATLSDIQTEVSNIIDQAPETLNTLNELSKALGDDPNFATTITTQIGLKQDIIADLETIRSGAALGATALQSFTESDPTVPAWAKESSKPSYSYNEIIGKPDFATVATSGDYDDLSNKPTIPTIPTNVSAFINDTGYLTDYTETDPTVPSWAKQPSKPSYSYSEITGKPNLSAVATSGSYNDLTDKPDIPAAQIQSDWNQSNTSAKDFIKNKPTIPTVPTNVSAFTNDAGYLTEHQDISGKANSDDLATVAFSGDYEDLENTPVIPDVPEWAMSSTKPSYTAAEVGALPDDTVLFSGDYNDLSNKPDIPDDSDLVHKSGNEDITGEKTFVGHKLLKFKQSKSTDKIGFTGYNTSNVECGNFEILPNDRAVNLGIYAPDIKPNSDWLVGFKYQAKDSAGTVHKFGLRAPSRFGNSTYAEHYIPISINDKEANNTGAITLTASDIEALPSSIKYGTSLNLSIDSTTYVVTALLKDQDGNNLGTAQTIDLPLESVVISGSYDSTTKKVILTLKDGSTVDFSIADLVSGLLTEITSTNKLSADLISDGSVNKVINIQSDWNETNTSSDAYIQNKPTIPNDSTLIHKDIGNGIVETGLSVHEIDIYRAKIRDYHGTESEVLGTLLINNDDGSGEILLEDEDQDGFAQIKRKNGNSFETLQEALNARNNVQADWNQTATTAADYIKNKPSIAQDQNGSMIINPTYLSIDTNNGFGGIDIDGGLALTLTAMGNSINFQTGTEQDQLKIYGEEGVFIEGANNKNIKLTTSGNGKAYYNNNEIATKNDIPTIPTNISTFTNDVGYLTSETDPTVPAWAKASTKPTYTAAEVGALPDTTVIPQVLDYPLGTETDAAPSVSAVQRWISEVDFRTYIDDNTIGINTDEEMYVKSLSADKLTNGTNNKVFTASEQTKLSGIAAGAEVNVRSDWNETNISSDAFIKNKPNIVNSIDGFSGSVSTVGKRLTTASVPNVTSVGSASTWNFSMGTGNDIHTLIITGNNSTTPTLGTSITVATGSLSSSGQGGYVITGISGSGGSND